MAIERERERDTVGKNSFGAPKIQNKFWCLIKLFIYQYCDRNIELFSITLHIIIKLCDSNNCRSQSLCLFFSSYYYFSYIHSYCSTNYCKFAIKGDNKMFKKVSAVASKSAIKKRSRDLMITKMWQSRLRAIT